MQTCEHVCRIFQRDVRRLYALSFLLTADHALAEQCFVQSLDDSLESDRSGSRISSTIARNAIRISRLRWGDTLKEHEPSGHDSLDHPAELTAVVALPPFERFVFVLSILERYTDEESSRLLNCSVDDVATARVNALQSIVQQVKPVTMHDS